MDRKKFLLFFSKIYIAKLIVDLFPRYRMYYHCLGIIVRLIFNIIDNLRLKTVEGDGELNDEINCVK